MPMPPVSFEHLDPVNRVDKLLIEHKLDAEIAQAFSYAQEHVPKEPLGVTVPLRKDHTSLSEGLLISGTLSQLDLSCPAIQGGTDVARIRHVLMEGIDLKDLRALIGTIIVNTSTVGGNLQRANKDGEVAALCLLIFWQSTAAVDPDTSKRLMDTACDLSFECQSCGSGSAFESRKLLIVEQEEKRRNVMGVSAWRRAVQLSKQLALIKAECRHEDVKADSDRLLSVLKEDKVYGSEMKADTLARYLGVAKRLQDDQIRALFLTWEALEGRAALSGEC